MKYAFGIDLGGTNIKLAAVDFDGVFLHKASRSSQGQQDSNSQKDFPYFAQEIREMLLSVEAELGSSPEYVGLAAPGLAASDAKSIAYMPGRLNGLEGFNWSEFLGRNTAVLDDAKAALLAECWKGAASGLRNVILITLGTGVGGAILADGRLLNGHIGRAGNLGHFCLNIDGAPDITGMPGSLEQNIGDYSVSERSQMRFKSTKELVAAANEGDSQAGQIWLKSVKHLACAIASLINTIDPQVVLIGGGIAAAGAALFEPLNETLDKIEWRPNQHRVKILPAALGNWAGSMGAARFAMTYFACES